MTLRRIALTTIAAAALLAALGCSKPADKAPEGAAMNGAAAGGGSAQSAGPGAPVSAHEGAPAAAPPAGTDQLPPGHPPIGDMQGADAGGGAAGAMGAPSAGGGAPAAGMPMTWTVPAAWMEQPVTSPMRKAQFKVPGGGSKNDGECVVFYFGPGQGGSPESNASRWVDQFQQPDGSSSQGKSKVDLKTINGNQVMFVEVKGTYMPTAMGGSGSPEPRPGYALVGAIVSAPDAPWFFKMTGPEKTVAANRAAFDELIASLKSGG